MPSTVTVPSGSGELDDPPAEGAAPAVEGVGDNASGVSMSRQEVLAMAADIAKQEVTIEHSEHLLKTLTTNSDGPELWRESEMKVVRECCQFIKAHPQEFPPMPGDNMPDGSCFANCDTTDTNAPPCLTANYITAIAEFQPLDFSHNPVLQVVSEPVRKFETNVNGRGETGRSHFTNLRLCDGSNDVMKGRLSMDLAHDGKKLKVGDIIELDLFTPLTYRDSGEEKPYRSPAVVIHSYSKVGYALIPDNLHLPKHCAVTAVGGADAAMLGGTKEQSCENGTADAKYGEEEEWEELVEVECTPENRFCALYGLNPVLCICETDPVDLLDLEAVHEFCWFATTEVAKMKPTWKRNMLFWWYMTNIYNICGKGRRRPPPACLKAAIRKSYPEPNGRYKCYKPGANQTVTKKAGKKPTSKKRKESN